jgi:hypothetical protein
MSAGTRRVEAAFAMVAELRGDRIPVKKNFLFTPDPFPTITDFFLLRYSPL